MSMSSRAARAAQRNPILKTQQKKEGRRRGRKSFCGINTAPPRDDPDLMSGPHMETKFFQVSLVKVKSSWERLCWDLWPLRGLWM